VTAAIPNFDGNLTSEQKVFIKEKYDALVNRQSNASKEVFVERSVSFGAVLDQAFAPSAPETQVGS